MTWDLLFVLNSALLGVGLAMDAFSVSLANGLQEPKMAHGRMCRIAGVFAVFQAVMPMTGWLSRFIPFIALALLSYIGGKMVLDGLSKKGTAEAVAVGVGALLMQGVATSIDALSVGFTIAEYAFPMALACSLIVAAVTFGICMMGLALGKRFGTRFAGKASVLGGLILIAIGLEIFFTSVLK